MKYTIISIDDSRANYKHFLRKDMHTMQEVAIPAVDAKSVDLRVELDRRDLSVTYSDAFSIGEIGVWLSVFDCWQWAIDNDEEILVFEDDAIIAGNLEVQLGLLMEEVPRDYDYVSLWVPPNQIQDYNYVVVFNDEGLPTINGTLDNNLSFFDFGAERVAEVYQGYGNVATVFSPKGARFFIDRAREVGIYTPIDCLLAQAAHAGRCKGYAPKPRYATLVSYDWATTTVHETPRYSDMYGDK